MNNFFLIVLGFVVFNCAGTRPTNLGVKEGKLLVCPETPNCVSSQVLESDSHYIKPYKYSKDLKTAFNDLKSVIESIDRTKIINFSDVYMYAEFTSLIMRYVDDVEFYFDDVNKTVHIRSASRLGKGDMGANRKRMELIREKLNW